MMTVPESTEEDLTPIVPEDVPVTNGKENLFRILKDKTQELFDRARAKFKPKDHDKVDSYLKDKDDPRASPAEKKTFAKTKQEQWKSLVDAVQTEALGAELIPEVKQATTSLVNEASGSLSSMDLNFMRTVAVAAEKLDNTTAMPFARYVIQLSERGLVQTTSAANVIEKLRLLKQIFLDEAELSGDSLATFAQIYASALNQYAPYFSTRQDLTDLRKLHEGMRSWFPSFPQNEQERIEKALLNMNEKVRQSRMERHGDGEAHEFGEVYIELENGIEALSVDDKKKRELKYKFLELDIDKITKQLRADPKHIDETWAKIQTDYVREVSAAASELAPVARRYIESMAEMLKAKMVWVENWTLQGGGLNEADPLSRMYRQNLKDVFKNDYDQSLVAFALFESEDEHIKDIYMRFKMKSFLEELKHHNHEEYEHIHHELMDGGNLKIDYREIEEVILKDIKRIWVKRIRLDTEGKPGVNSLNQMISRLTDFFTTKGRLSESKFSFLGEGPRKDDENSPKKHFTQVDILTPRTSEINMNPLYRTGGFARVGEKGIRPDHQDLADLMMVFYDRVNELGTVVKESKSIVENVAKGDTEALQKAAHFLNNYVFGALASDAPLITVAMQAYVESFRKLIAMGRGQIRPGMFSAGEVGETSVQSAYIYNAMKGVSPDEEDDAIVVFSTIGKALAWGIGDLAPQLARCLPPKDVLVREIDKHSAELATRVRAVKEQYADATPEEREKRVIDKIWNYLNTVSPQLGLNAYDEFARGLLFKTNPIFNYLLWVDEMQEFHVNDLMFGGAFNLMEDAKETGIAGFLKNTRRAFGKSDTMTDPGEVLYLADKERESLYFGMDDDVMEQRLQGKVPMSIRLPNMAGNLGIGERGAWRDNAFNLEALVSKYIKSEKVRGDMSKFKMSELVDMALQIGPRTALILIDRLNPDRKPAPDPYFVQFNKNPAEYKKLKNYVYAVAYEMFPSLFALRTDLRRFTHKKDKVFLDEWQKTIEAKLAAEQSRSPAEQRLRQLLPKDERFLEAYYNSTDAQLEHYGKVDIEGSFVQGILTDGLMALEKYVMNRRNISGLQVDKRVTLRDVLADLAAKGTESEFYKDGAGRYYIPILQQYDLKVSLNDALKITSENLFEAFYGKSSAKVTFASVSGGEKPKRGFYDGLTYRNIGADTRSKREQRTDIFGLMQGVEKRFTGPMFDFYYENIYMSDPDIFDPQRTGDRFSGKGITVRAFTDFGSYLKGVEGYMAAMKVIPAGIKSENKEDLGKAEDDYLSKALESAQSFESYTNNEKRYEIGSYFVILWLTMGKAPSQWGGDVRLLQELRRRMQGGQSLAEILNPKQGGLLALQSAMRYDYIGIQNFIFKAQKKGLLPLSTEGKDVKPVHKVKEQFAKKWFSKIDDELSKINDKMENLPEGEHAAFWDKFKKSMLEKTSNFGNAHFIWKFEKKDKAKFNARRLYDMMGVNWQKNTVQYGMYFLMFIGLITVLALQQGFKELDSK